MKTNIHKPKTILEAINDLEVFLECDLYTKFRPTDIILNKIKKDKKKVWYRKDFFKNEHEFIIYLREHFDILEKQVKKLKEKDTSSTKNEQ